MSIADSQLAFEEWPEGETPQEIWRASIATEYKGKIVHLVKYAATREAVEHYVKFRCEKGRGEVKGYTIQKFVETERHAQNTEV